MKQFYAVKFLPFVAFTMMLTLLSCEESRLNDSVASNKGNGGAKYVFFFIGDGMATAQLNSTAMYKAYTEEDMANSTQISQPPKNALNITSLPVMGMTTTYAYDRYITDSAAAGTALACGHKTTIGTISKDGISGKDYTTIAELAKAGGKKVGIVSSVSIDHATPACFYAHNASRNMYEEIGRDLFESGFDYFAGGGFRKNKWKQRADIAELIAKNNFTFVETRADFDALEIYPNERIIAINPYLDNSYAMPYTIDVERENVGVGGEYQGSVSLAEYTQKGIELMQDNSDGFFMMVEGGKIDWTCHANDAGTVIHDVLAFDDAVGVALDFYEQHPKETLIVVTGDHETGGLTMGFAGTKYASFYDKIGEQGMSYQDFDRLFMSGSHSDLNELNSVIEKYFGLDMDGDGEGIRIDDYQKSLIENAFVDLKADDRRKESAEYSLLYGPYNALSISITHVLNQTAGIGWTSYSHTGAPVPTYARGVDSDLFAGLYDNTDIPKKLKSAMAL